MSVGMYMPEASIATSSSDRSMFQMEGKAIAPDINLSFDVVLRFPIVERFIPASHAAALLSVAFPPALRNIRLSVLLAKMPHA
jgi:hypothetical protein